MILLMNGHDPEIGSVVMVISLGNDYWYVVN